MQNDRIIRCLAHKGKVNVRCINSKNIVEEARKLHDLSPTATAALGRLLTITSLLGKEMKDEKGTITHSGYGHVYGHGYFCLCGDC